MSRQYNKQYRDYHCWKEQDEVQGHADFGVASQPYSFAEEGETRGGGVAEGGILEGFEGWKGVGGWEALLRGLEVVHLVWCVGVG